MVVQKNHLSQSFKIILPKSTFFLVFKIFKLIIHKSIVDVCQSASLLGAGNRRAAASSGSATRNESSLTYMVPVYRTPTDIYGVNISSLINQ